MKLKFIVPGVPLIRPTLSTQVPCIELTSYGSTLISFLEILAKNDDYASIMTLLLYIYA